MTFAEKVRMLWLRRHGAGRSAAADRRLLASLKPA